MIIMTAAAKTVPRRQKADSLSHPAASDPAKTALWC